LLRFARNDGAGPSKKQHLLETVLRCAFSRDAANPGGSLAHFGEFRPQKRQFKENGATLFALHMKSVFNAGPRLTAILRRPAPQALIIHSTSDAEKAPLCRIAQESRQGECSCLIRLKFERPMIFVRKKHGFSRRAENRRRTIQNAGYA
jgi:hypothetical protein